MTYGELKDAVLQLLNQYSMAGEEIPLSYNEQADLVRRIPALTRDGLLFLATSVRRLRAVEALERPRTVGGWQLYELPKDLYQLAGGLLVADGDGLHRCRDYRTVGGRAVLVPGAVEGAVLAEYFRYPDLPGSSPAEGDYLDCPPEAQSALAYYVAAHLAMEDNGFLYGALRSEFERKLACLQEGPFCECGVTENVYV